MSVDTNQINVTQLVSQPSWDTLMLVDTNKKTGKTRYTHFFGQIKMYCRPVRKLPFFPVCFNLILIFS